MPKNRKCFKFHVIGEGRTVAPHGREFWALKNLYEAGENGCTPIDHPGPRWSAYVYDLRHEFGLNIETVTEKHGGDFPGTHARYILRTQVEPMEGGVA